MVTLLAAILSFGHHFGFPLFEFPQVVFVMDRLQFLQRKWSQLLCVKCWLQRLGSMKVIIISLLFLRRLLSLFCCVFLANTSVLSLASNALFLPPLLETKKCWHDVNITHNNKSEPTVQWHWPFCCYGVLSWALMQWGWQHSWVEHSSNLEGGCHLENRDVSLENINSISVCTLDDDSAKTVLASFIFHGELW